jgi:hypothetical protein
MMTGNRPEVCASGDKKKINIFIVSVNLSQKSLFLIAKNIHINTKISGNPKTVKGTERFEWGEKLSHHKQEEILNT